MLLEYFQVDVLYQSKTHEHNMTSKVAQSFEMTCFLEKDVNNRESRGRFCFQFKHEFIKKQFIKTSSIGFVQ